MIDPRKLEIISDSLFNSDVKPILDDELAVSLGFDSVQDEALNISHKTREQLALAPEPKQVWESWMEHIQKYRKKGNGAWAAPIRCGYNINNCDNVIVDRYCEKYGPWDEVWGTQSAFHPVISYDLIQEFWRITENLKINSNHSISLDSIREWLGMSKDGAHDAKVDILDSAELAIRTLKLSRKMSTGFECAKCTHPFKIQFEDSMKQWIRPTI